MPFKTVANLGKKRKVSVPAKKKAMSVFELVMENITTRRSVRKFLKNDVSPEDVSRLLEAARHAPSAANRQPWEFVIVRDPGTKKHLAEAADGQAWIADAPVIIVACINTKIAGSVAGERGLRLFGIQDVAAAIENLLLAANALGLGAVWVGDFREVKVSVAVHCPEHIRPCALVPVGWPAEAPEMPARHSQSEFVHAESYGNTARALFIWGRSRPHD